MSISPQLIFVSKVLCRVKTGEVGGELLSKSGGTDGCCYKLLAEFTLRGTHGTDGFPQHVSAKYT